MSLGVSSWFAAQAQRPTWAPTRHFTLSGSELGAAVLRWPVLQTALGGVALHTVQITLSNADRRLDSLIGSAGAILASSCEIALSATHPQSGPERVVLFSGLTARLRTQQTGAVVALELQGRTRALGDAALGTDSTSGALLFTSSAWHPADLAWRLLTEYGGYASTQSSSNADLDHATWLRWRQQDAARDIRVQARLRGERLLQVLDHLTRLAGRGVGLAGGRLSFPERHPDPGEALLALDPTQVLELEAELDPDQVLNRFETEVNYDLASEAFQSTASAVHSASIARHGEHAGRFSSTVVWFVSGADGLPFVEDQVRFGHDPAPWLRARLPLGAGLSVAPGDAVTLAQSWLPVPSSAWRVQAQALDLAQGTALLTLEPARRRRWVFDSQVASATLELQSLRATEGGALLAVGGADANPRLYRAESGGAFQTSSLWASAVLPLEGAALALGGAASAGAGSGVLRRSADGGGTAVTVHSLPAGIKTVHDLYEVRSGTLLASTTSGAILRSTDAGSSWAVTQTISGAYHVRRFFSPRSGTLWGATGQDNPALAEGLHLWESADAGVSWLPRHRVLASGDYHANGLFHLTDSEWLLATIGAGAAQRGVLRAKYTSAASIAWVWVQSGASFSHALRTGSGHLLFGWEEPDTIEGGSVWRSTDQGSSWAVDAQVAKRGNLRLLDESEGAAPGTVDALLSSLSGDPRTVRFHNPAPDDLG